MESQGAGRRGLVSPTTADHRVDQSEFHVLRPPPRAPRSPRNRGAGASVSNPARQACPFPSLRRILPRGLRPPRVPGHYPASRSAADTATPPRKNAAGTSAGMRRGVNAVLARKCSARPGYLLGGAVAVECRCERHSDSSKPRVEAALRHRGLQIARAGGDHAASAR